MELLRFTAPWCEPCKALAANLATADTGLKTTVIDIETDPVKGASHKIRGVPTLILMKDGVEMSRKVGAMTVSQIKDWVDGYNRPV